MTRETAKKRIKEEYYISENYGEYVAGAYEISNLIDAIYDYFENKVCENCKYFEDATNCRHPYNKQYYCCDGDELGMPMMVCKKFGCNLFEKK